MVVCFFASTCPKRSMVLRCLFILAVPSLAICHTAYMYCSRKHENRLTLSPRPSSSLMVVTAAK